MIRPRTQDDSGASIPLVMFNMTYLPIAAGPLPRLVQRRLRTAAFRESERLGSRFSPTSIAVAMLPALGSFAPMLFWFAYQRVDLVFWALLITTPAMSVAMWFLSPFGLHPRTRRACALEAVQAGFCGACGYPLPQAMARDDTKTSEHLTRCPECGAAWKT